MQTIKRLSNSAKFFSERWSMRVFCALAFDFTRHIGVKQTCKAFVDPRTPAAPAPVQAPAGSLFPADMSVFDIREELRRRSQSIVEDLLCCRHCSVANLKVKRDLWLS